MSTAEKSSGWGAESGLGGEESGGVGGDNNKEERQGLSVNHQAVHLGQSSIKNPRRSQGSCVVGQLLGTANTKDGFSLTGEGERLPVFSWLMGCDAPSAASS